MKFWLSIGLVLLSTRPALTQHTSPLIQPYSAPPAKTQPIPEPNCTIYLGPIREDAHGPGIHADPNSKPFYWQPEGLPKVVVD